MFEDVTVFHSERTAKRMIAYARMFAKLTRQWNIPTE